MRYHLFQKFFGKMVKINEMSLLSQPCWFSIDNHCILSNVPVNLQLSRPYCTLWIWKIWPEVTYLDMVWWMLVLIVEHDNNGKLLTDLEFSTIHTLTLLFSGYRMMFDMSKLHCRLGLLVSFLGPFLLEAFQLKKWIFINFNEKCLCMIH